MKAHHRHTPRLLVVILGALAAFGPMSVDMYLPSLPTIARELSSSAGGVQLTLSAFFVGFAAGQLLYGTLSDRLGRKPVLVAGISLYIVSSAMCAMSPDIRTLILFRLLHALGGGAGVVVARAIVRDRFTVDQRASVLSFMTLVTALAPLVAPLLGGWVLKWLGWRAIFWLLTAFGAACLLAVLLVLPESNPPHRRSRAGLIQVLAGFRTIFSDVYTVGCILAGGFAFAGMLAYISGSPFVYIELFGVSPQHYGYLFGLNIVGLMIGAFLNARLVTRFGAQRLMRLGAAIIAAAGIVLLLTAWTGVAGLAGIVIPLFFCVSTLSLVGANSIALASEHFPTQAGAVVALCGAAQFGLGALAGSAVGQLHDTTATALPMAAVIAVCGLLSLASALLLARRR